MNRSKSLMNERRKCLEEYLRVSWGGNKNLFESNQDAIFALDLDGYFVQVNPACEKIFGYASEELLTGLAYQSIVSVEDLSMVFNHIHKALNGQVQNFDCKIASKNDEYVFVNLSAAPISVNDEIVGLYGVAKDITELKRKNEEYRNSSEMYRILLDNSFDVITRIDLQGRLVYISPACTKVLGYNPEELEGTNSFDLIHKDDLLRALQGSQKLSKGLESYLDTYRVRKKDGSYIWVEALCKAIIDEETKTVKEMISAARDITRRKIAEEDVKNNEESYRNLVEHSPDAVVLVDDTGTILYINDTGTKLFGASEKSNLVGKEIFDLLHPDYFDRFKKRIKFILEGIAEPFIEKKFRGIDGREFFADVKGIQTLFQNKTAIHIIIRDIEDKKRTEELLLQSEKLTVAGQLAAGIAHEVRNPLTAIKGFLQLMEDQFDEKRTYFNIITSEINRIELILTELLSLAKPQDMKLRTINLEDLVQEVKALIDTQAIMNNILIYTVFHSEIPDMTCDVNQLKQVFINLLKNSIEAMPNGGSITIDVIKQGSDKVKFLIIDTGEGIPEDILQRIGEPFFTTKEKGTGLGLMICKQIIENHNGTINFRSDKSGTIIEIILPLER